MWPIMHFCPDLAYLVDILSHFCSKPRLIYIELVKYILQYVSRTLELGLTFNRKKNTLDNLIKYIGSDFG